MQRIVVVGKLRPGAADRAAELIAGGPPFSPRGAGFERHSVFLAPDEVIFLFEGGSLAPLARLLAEPEGEPVLGAWQEVLEGMPQVAREAYSWVRPADTFAPGWE